MKQPSVSKNDLAKTISPFVEKRIRKSIIKLLGNLDLKIRGIVIQYLTILSNNGLYYFDVTRLLFACKEAIIHFECQDDEFENNYKERLVPKYFWADDKGGLKNRWVEYDLKTCNKIYRAGLSGVPYVGVDKERFFDVNRLMQVRFDNHKRVRAGRKEDNKKKQKEESETYKWFWSGDGSDSKGENVWIEYNSDTCDKLEEGFTKRSKYVAVDSERFVDTVLMVQRRKDAHYRMRKVKRVSSGPRLDNTLNGNKNNNTNNINNSPYNTPISTPTKSTPSTPIAEDTPTKSMGLLNMLFGAMKTSDSPVKEEPTKSMASKILDKLVNSKEDKPVKFETFYGLTRDQFSSFIVILEDYLNKHPEKHEDDVYSYTNMSNYNNFTTISPVKAEINSNKTPTKSTPTKSTPTESTSTTTTATTTTNATSAPPKKEISQTCELIINSVIQLVLKNNLENEKSTIYLSYYL